MEKKNTGLIVLIVVLSIAVLGLGGFIIYDKVLNNDSKNNSNEINKEDNEISNVSKEEVLWLNDTLVQNLYNMVIFPGDDILGNWYFYENEKVTLDNISNDTKLYMAYTQLNKNDIEYKEDNLHGTKSFDINQFEIGMKNVFGNNITYEKNDFMPEMCDCEYKYNADQQKYICEIGGCGGPGESYVDRKLYNAVKISDEIILYEKFAFININEIIFSNSDPKYDGPKAGIYKDTKSKNAIKTWIKDVDYFYNNKPNYNFDDYIDQMSMVKYTFKKGDDNSYHFYSSEIVEDF